MWVIILSACMIENNFSHMENVELEGNSSSLTAFSDALAESDDEDDSYTATSEYAGSSSEPSEEPEIEPSSPSRCEEVVETVVWEISFPATQGCDWNIDGNSYEREAFFQARTEQRVHRALDFEEEIAEILAKRSFLFQE